MEIELLFLSMKKHPMFRLVVDFQLRMIRTHLTLAAGFGLPGQGDRRRVTRMAMRTTADGTVRVGSPDIVTTGTSFPDGCRAFEQGKRVFGPINSAFVILLTECNLLVGEVPRSGDGSPSWRSMSATLILVVFGRVAFSTVLRRQMPGNHKPLVVELRPPFFNGLLSPSRQR